MKHTGGSLSLRVMVMVRVMVKHTGGSLSVRVMVMVRVVKHTGGSLSVRFPMEPSPSFASSLISTLAFGLTIGLAKLL